MLVPEHDTAIQLLRLPVSGLHKAGPVNSQPWMEKELMGPCISLLNYSLPIDPGGGDITVFSYIPTGEYGARRQCVLLNPQSQEQPWWHSKGEKMNQKDVSAAKGFVGRRVLRGVGGRQERVGGGSSQSGLYMKLVKISIKNYAILCFISYQGTLCFINIFCFLFKELFA